MTEFTKNYGVYKKKARAELWYLFNNWVIGLARDPVCGMYVDEETAVYKTVVDDKTSWYTF